MGDRTEYRVAGRPARHDDARRDGRQHTRADARRRIAGRAAAQLVAWLRGNKVGDKRIRAGVPAGWAVGDKTGTGDYGTTNDAGVIWPTSRAPIVLAVYYTQTRADARAKDDVIASVARIVAQTFG